MSNRWSGNKGFTLIEILIVVVVIAVLASLTIPRMLSASEKASAAEAVQMLGAMVRAQQMNYDTGGSFVTINDNTTSLDWARLGMPAPGASVISGAGPKFDYTCKVSACKAVRSGSGDPTLAAKAIAVTSVNTAPLWNCNPNLASPAFYTSMSNGGCTVA